MKHIRCICMLMVSLLLSTCFTVRVMAEEEISASDIGSEIEAYVAEHADTTAGMSVAVFDEQETIYRNCFGYMDVQNQVPVTEDTVMEWGSVSKLLVWVSAMQLAEQGMIDLEADIDTYLPEGFLKNIEYDIPITMLNLMNHNAGFEESIIGMATGKEERIMSLEAYLIKYQPKQVFEPGTVCAYSNWSTTLAAYIVERVTGVPYYEYVKKNIFEPLEMHDTSLYADLSDNESVKERRKSLKIYTTNMVEITPNMSYVVMYPAGMCVSTIGDMQKFAQSLLSENSVLFQKKETYHELFSPSLCFEGTETPKNCHGFWSLESYGTRVIGHNGNTAGCSSSLLLDLENHVGMVVQTNQSSEQLYNNEMPELLFGKYAGTASDYAGLVRAARTIFHGPLKFYSLMSVYYIEPENPATSYSVRTTAFGVDRLSLPYGDYLVIGVKDILLDLIVAGLYVLGLIYCVINIVRCLIQGLLGKIKGENEKKALSLWCAVGLLLPFFPVVVFALIVPTLFNFQQWSTLGYGIAFFLILVSALVMLAMTIYGFMKQKNDITKTSRKIYIHSINICMLITIINIFYWNWGMFWML